MAEFNPRRHPQQGDPVSVPADQQQLMIELQTYPEHAAYHQPATRGVAHTARKAVQVVELVAQLATAVAEVAPAGKVTSFLQKLLAIRREALELMPDPPADAA